MSGSAHAVQMGAAGACSCGWALLGRAATRLHPLRCTTGSLLGSCSTQPARPHTNCHLVCVVLCFQKGNAWHQELDLQGAKKTCKGKQTRCKWDIRSLTDLWGVHASRVHGSACHAAQAQRSRLPPRQRHGHVMRGSCCTRSSSRPRSASRRRVAARKPAPTTALEASAASNCRGYCSRRYAARLPP